MLTNFELKRLKPKLDIVEKPENRVHKLTDSNGAAPARVGKRSTCKKMSFLPIQTGFPRESAFRIDIQFLNLTAVRSSECEI